MDLRFSRRSPFISAAVTACLLAATLSGAAAPSVGLAGVEATSISGR